MYTNNGDVGVGGDSALLSPTSTLRLHFDDLSAESDDVPDDRKRLWGIMPVPLFVSEKITPWMVEQGLVGAPQQAADGAIDNQDGAASMASSVSSVCSLDNCGFSVLKKVLFHLKF